MEGHEMHTSTPIVSRQFVAPPPRKLWSADSPAQILYRNKWMKYRNSLNDEEKNIWNNVDAPCYTDFRDIPSDRDSVFGDAGEESNFRGTNKNGEEFLNIDTENNNILQDLENWSLSTIRSSEGDVPEDKNVSKIMQTDFNEICSDKVGDEIPSRVFNNFEEEMKIQESSNPQINNRRQSGYFGSDGIIANKKLEDRSEEKTLEAKVEKEETKDKFQFKKPETKIEWKKMENKFILQKPENIFEFKKPENKLENKGGAKRTTEKKTCTTAVPFSFENREKLRHEHTQARRERDSFGQELPKGFRANPLPNFLKLRNRDAIIGKSAVAKKPSSETKKEARKIEEHCDKNKTCQPTTTKPASAIVPKAPKLLTALRAERRQQLDEHLREKERRRLELEKKEEAERKKREEEEIRKLRRQLVHKAQPIRRYKVFVPDLGKRKLSDPSILLAAKRPRKM